MHTKTSTIYSKIPPREETRLRLDSCLLCKMALIWGSVQFVGGDAAPIIGHLETHNSGEKPCKSKMLPFSEIRAIIRVSAQCVGVDAAPNYWICTNLRREMRGEEGVRESLSAERLVSWVHPYMQKDWPEFRTMKQHEATMEHYQTPISESVSEQSF